LGQGTVNEIHTLCTHNTSLKKLPISLPSQVCSNFSSGNSSKIAESHATGRRLHGTEEVLWESRKVTKQGSQ